MKKRQRLASPAFAVADGDTLAIPILAQVAECCQISGRASAKEVVLGIVEGVTCGLITFGIWYGGGKLIRAWRPWSRRRTWTVVIPD